MITIAIDSASTAIANETFQVKSVSAAWNKIREIRDNNDPAQLIGTIARVTNDDPTADMSRIPAAITFLPNKKGKMEFKDLQKIQDRQEKAAAKAAKIEKDEEVEVEVEIENFPDQGEEFINQDLALSKLD